MSVIDDLEKKIQSLRGQLDAANKSLIAAKLEVCPAKVGMIVRTKGVKGEEYRVSHVGVDYWTPNNKYSRPRLTGNTRKKDGTWGTAERNIYPEWEVVEQSS